MTFSMDVFLAVLVVGGAGFGDGSGVVELLTRTTLLEFLTDTRCARTAAIFFFFLFRRCPIRMSFVVQGHDALARQDKQVQQTSLSYTRYH